jgi:hypothetical protein
MKSEIFENMIGGVKSQAAADAPNVAEAIAPLLGE